MYKLKRLVLHNFLSFKDLEINFTKRGVYLIQGHNLKGGDSNGSGKSAILSGITWALFGKDQLGRSGKDVIRWGEKTGSAILILADGKRDVEIVRGTDTLEVRIGGQVQAGNKRSLQDVINSTLNTDYSLFTTFNVFTKSWSNFFTEVGDADKKRLFKTILRMDKIDEALDKAKKIYAGLAVNATKTETLIEQLSEGITKEENELAAAIELRDHGKEIKEKSIREMEEWKEARRPTEADYTDEIAAIDKKLSVIDPRKLAEQLEFLNIQQTNLNALIYAEQDAINRKDEEIRAFTATGGECDKCGQAIPPRHRQAHRRHMEILRNEMVNAVKDNVAKKDVLSRQLWDTDTKIKEHADLLKQRSDLEMLMWKYKTDLENYETYCIQADTIIAKMRSEQTVYDEIVDKTEAKLNGIRAELTQRKETFVALSKEMDMYKYIQWLYSRQGIVSTLIERCFGRLKFLANRYLNKICNEGFRIDISPQRELKSGQVREEIDFFIWDEGMRVPYTSLSSGQQQRINTAMLFALYSWGREIGTSQLDFIFLDEIMDLSLGEKGQEDTLGMIYFFRPQIWHIMLITHKEAMTGRFDKEIEVIRNNEGVSKVL